MNLSVGRLRNIFYSYLTAISLNDVDAACGTQTPLRNNRRTLEVLQESVHVESLGRADAIEGQREFKLSCAVVQGGLLQLANNLRLCHRHDLVLDTVLHSELDHKGMSNLKSFI